MLNYKRGQKIAAIHTTISAKRLHVLKRNEPTSTQKSVRIGRLLSHCARVQVGFMVDAYSLRTQASHAGRS